MAPSHKHQNQVCFLELTKRSRPGKIVGNITLAHKIEAETKSRHLNTKKSTLHKYWTSQKIAKFTYNDLSGICSCFFFGRRPSFSENAPDDGLPGSWHRTGRACVFPRDFHGRCSYSESRCGQAQNPDFQRRLKSKCSWTIRHILQNGILCDAFCCHWFLQ